MATPIEIYGFHGTTADREKSINNCGFKHSRRKDKWLGEGIYFWQDAPKRAWEWAVDAGRKRHQRPVVIGAKIRFEIGPQEGSEQYLDFLDISNEEDLVQTYRELRIDYERTGQELPPQTPDEHGLDHEVIEKLVRNYKVQGVDIYAVRATFHQEGGPIYEFERNNKRVESALYTRSQVQIAVRNAGIIIDTWPEERKTKQK